MIKCIAKSLAVKSVRIGWPAGIYEAARHLAPSELRSVLVGQVFEDLFPEPGSVCNALAEIERGDWIALCERDTHHTVPGLTRWIMVKVPLYQEHGIDMVCKCNALYGVRLPPRAAGCFGAWLGAAEYAVGHRALDSTLFEGVPDAVLDMHVGRWRGETTLSGTCANHVRLADWVQRDGWAAVRRVVHA